MSGIKAMKYRDVIRMIESDGWRICRSTGSHLIYDHPVKRGIVTVSGGGKLNRDIPPGTLASILKQAGLKKKD